jgi:hypothetical protein
MKLHANAALTLNNRRRLVRRVVEEGWSMKAAALAARPAREPLQNGLVATGPRASSAYWIAPRHQGRWRTEHPTIAFR